MKDITVLFDGLIEKVDNETNQAKAMKNSMAMREFFLLNLSTSELHSLATEVKRIVEVIESTVMTKPTTDAELLAGKIPNLVGDDSLENLPEETIMLLTNMTVDYLLSIEETVYSELTIEEFIRYYTEMRPKFSEVLGESDESYTPITYDQYEKYLKAIDTMNENMDKIREGDLTSLTPLYSPELLNVEDAIDDLYSFTIRLRYDLALIWAIRKKFMKIEPVVEGNVPTDWEMEIAPHFVDSVKVMLDNTYKSEED